MLSKIYWYGFKRQLYELYCLLISEKYISCSWDEFFSHFTGKKFYIQPELKIKLKWLGEDYLLAIMAAYLLEKGFFGKELCENITDILMEHFAGVTKQVLADYEKNNSKPSAKKFRQKLEMLLPATSGYRCKTRLFYKARNKKPQKAVLLECGIILP